MQSFQAPLCKGSSAAGGEGLFLQHSNRYAVSEPVSATPASMLRTLANPLCKGSSAAGGEGLFLQPFHHFVVPLPLHRGGEIRTRLGETCKCASHTRKSNPSRRRLQACFAYLQIPLHKGAFLNQIAALPHLFSSIFSLLFSLKKAARRRLFWF